MPQRQRRNVDALRPLPEARPAPAYLPRFKGRSSNGRMGENADGAGVAIRKDDMSHPCPRCPGTTLQHLAYEPCFLCLSCGHRFPDHAIIGPVHENNNNCPAQSPIAQPPTPIMAKGTPYTEAENEILRRYYAERTGKGMCLYSLAFGMGRSRYSVAIQASRLGLCESNRSKTKEHCEKMCVIRAGTKPILTGTATFPNGVHPRGMLGKKHTEATKTTIGNTNRGKKRSPESIMQRMKTNVMKYGSVAPKVKRGSWHAAWREIGGRKIFARSRWEANYARYLEWLKQNKQILDWEHEPETFWFEKIKRGCRSYLPDFRVTALDGTIAYHETKGWMDARSLTKIRRMKKYHPLIVLIVRDSAWFKANTKTLRGVVPQWEQG